MLATESIDPTLQVPEKQTDPEPKDTILDINEFVQEFITKNNGKRSIVFYCKIINA